jgi:hypothetical protein
LYEATDAVVLVREAVFNHQILIDPLATEARFQLGEDGVFERMANATRYLYGRV